MLLFPAAGQLIICLQRTRCARPVDDMSASAPENRQDILLNL